MAAAGAALLVGSLLSACSPLSDGPAICAADQLTATVHGDQHDNTSIYRVVTVRDQGPACLLPKQSTVSMTAAGQRLGRPGSYDPYGSGGSDATGQQRPKRAIALPHRGTASMSVIIALADSTRCDRDPVDALHVQLSGSAAISAAVPPHDRPHSLICDQRSSSVMSFGRWVPGAGA
ncbi:hypothetical protein [Amnibacterium kyonggiense]|uniref:hypothetical protein n=1 Tax=Amnibacterium kyonggiense TaxID=595671 RepID=UPI00105EAA75|nr:hypothetical protein [Amnibacterium kyonggiense]